MTVRVLLFAAYRDLTGREAVELALPDPPTVAALLTDLQVALPAAGQLPARPLVAVNQVHATLSTRLAAGDEVALLPPLAGG